jgi:hypothetical protein
MQMPDKNCDFDQKGTIGSGDEERPKQTMKIQREEIKIKFYVFSSGNVLSVYICIPKIEDLLIDMFMRESRL